MVKRKQNLSWKVLLISFIGLPLLYIVPLASDRMLSTLGTIIYSLYILSIPIAFILLLITPLLAAFLVAKCRGVELEEVYESYGATGIQKLIIVLVYAAILAASWTTINFCLDIMDIQIPSGTEIEDWIRINTL